MNVLTNIKKICNTVTLHSWLAFTKKPHSIYRLSTIIAEKMSKPKVYATQKILTEEAIDILEKDCEVSSWTGEGPVPRTELLKNISGKDGLFCCLNDKVDEEVLNVAGPNLKIVGSMSVGYDHLDVQEIKKRGIKMSYTPGVLTDATAELTVALLLATSRRLIEASAEAKSGGWKAWAPYWMTGYSLVNSTVGIFGFGRIGQEVAKRLKSFKIKQLLYTGRSEKPEAKELGAAKVDFDRLLAESDFIVVTCALTPDTKEVFNKCTFKKMKSNALFINSSRGGVVNQNDLIEALKENVIAGAGLDVTTPEPLPCDNELFQLKNCVVLPHIGSACITTRDNMAILTAKNVVAAIKGEKMISELVV